MCFTCSNHLSLLFNRALCSRNKSKCCNSPLSFLKIQLLPISKSIVEMMQEANRVIQEYIVSLGYVCDVILIYNFDFAVNALSCSFCLMNAMARYK